MPLSNQVFVFPILNLFAESRIPGKLKLGDWGHIVSVSGPGWLGWELGHSPGHCGLSRQTLASPGHSGTNTDTGATLHTEP